MRVLNLREELRILKEVLFFHFFAIKLEFAQTEPASCMPYIFVQYISFLRRMSCDSECGFPIQLISTITSIFNGEKCINNTL